LTENTIPGHEFIYREFRIETEQVPPSRIIPVTHFQAVGRRRYGKFGNLEEIRIAESVEETQVIELIEQQIDAYWEQRIME